MAAANPDDWRRLVFEKDGDAIPNDEVFDFDLPFFGQDHRALGETGDAICRDVERPRRWTDKKTGARRNDREAYFGDGAN